MTGTSAVSRATILAGLLLFALVVAEFVVRPRIDASAARIVDVGVFAARAGLVAIAVVLFYRHWQS